MKFSILVPVYNVEKYLEQCVDSLLNQTFKGNYEIVLVDDGSTDSSGKICDKYAENNPAKIKIVHKENGGHTSARLEAIKNATGEYSLFCDSDDFVEENLLESVNNVLCQNPDTDMVMYSFSYYENEQKRPRKISVWDDVEIFEENSKQKPYDLMITTPYINSLWSKAIRTEFLKNDPIDYDVLKDKYIAEDAYIVTYFITACAKIININKPLYNYRIIQTSISRSCNISKLKKQNTLFYYHRLKNLLPLWGMDTPEYRKKLSARWLSEVMYTFTQYYENVAKKDRKAVLVFDWSSMLPEEAKEKTNNSYESKISRRLYDWLIAKKFWQIRFYFFKKKIYKKYRSLKSRLLK